VDFTKFRMAFPARVTIETKDGRRITERRNVPIGAPGVDGRAEAAEHKLLTEASRALGPQGALAARDAILALGTIPLDRLAGAVCARA
jgi:hypothetical protein